MSIKTVSDLFLTFGTLGRNQRKGTPTGGHPMKFRRVSGAYRLCRPVFFLSVLAIVTLFGTQTAQATPFFIDEFTVVKNGAPFFDDKFSGTAPPVAPNFANGTPASYFVNGTFTNVGNKVLMDRAQGAILPSGIDGSPFLINQALLLTNIDPTNTILGLKSNHTFSVTGIFDLVLPGPTNEAYGIRLADFTNTDAGDDIVDLLVQRVTGGKVGILFIDKDFIAHTFTVDGFALLDPSHDKIALTLTKPDAGSPNIQASYAYIDGGVTGPTTTFGGTANAFTDENFTRAVFIAFSPVPEPSSLLLLSSGLVGLGGAAAWRRQRRK